MLSHVCLLGWVPLLALGGCLTAESGAPVVELDRLNWRIGELEVESVLLLVDDMPAHQTTVRNSSERDLWWPGLNVHRTSAYGSSEGGGWARSGGNVCNSSRWLPEIAKGSVLMPPGDTRNYRDALPPLTPAQHSTVTRWSFHGDTVLPALQPVSEWPPFELSFTLEWGQDDGASVGTKAKDASD